MYRGRWRTSPVCGTFRWSCRPAALLKAIDTLDTADVEVDLVNTDCQTTVRPIGVAKMDQVYTESAVVAGREVARGSL